MPPYLILARGETVTITCAFMRVGIGEFSYMVGFHNNPNLIKLQIATLLGF